MSKIISLFFILCLAPLAAETSVQSRAIEQEYNALCHVLSRSMDDDTHLLRYDHIIESVSKSGDLITLNDGMSFSINWWYQSVPLTWAKGQRIHITYDFSYGQFKIEHAETKKIAWGSFKKFPSTKVTIKTIHKLGSDAWSKLLLSNNYEFKCVEDGLFGASDWIEKDQIIILANASGIYQLWNVEKKNIIDAKITANKNQKTNIVIEFDGILGLEERLNKKVLQQTEAVKAVSSSILIYSAGFKEKNKPISVFLFLGPSGVGKTELAKSLNLDLFKSEESMIRFDMSHFGEPHSSARLIGSPPGYVNHEEGGQLTEPLLENPNRVVLLDEMEKSHEQVRKVFLPIFDEGFILTNKNVRVDCQDAIFIMTSNLCGLQIAELFNMNYSKEEILEIIEPTLMEQLSPELYNRVQPIIFEPLQYETMESLVELMLKRLSDRVFESRQIYLTFDTSVKSYLIQNGFHPLLGARPLKKLIESKIVTELARKMIQEGIAERTNLIVSYDESQETVELIVQ